MQTDSTPPAAGPASSRKPVTGRQREMVIAADRIILGFSRHWLLYLNGLVLLYVGLPFLAPVFMKLGVTGPAHAIYTFYSALCHQLGFRSYFLFGEQATYPRNVFQQFTGISGDDLFGARAFIGNATLGYKVAFCERDVAIYAALLLGGLVFALPPVSKRLGPMPWLAYLLIGIVPIGIDGFWQLLSQYPYNLIPPFSLLPYHESSAFLRLLTGGLFGIANAWLALPYLKASFTDVRGELERKLARVDSAPSAA